MGSPKPYATNLDHLRGALLALNVRLHREVLRWRSTHHENASPDELLGLCLSDKDIDVTLDGLYAANAKPDADALDRAPIATLTSLLAEEEKRHTDREARALKAGVPLRLPRLAQRYDLDEFSQQVLLLTLAPELDRAYERLFGYLNNDITRRWPTVALALDLFCPDTPLKVRRRQAFVAQAPLRRHRLVQLSQDTGPLPPSLLSQGLKLEERIVADLLAADTLEASLVDLVELAAPAHSRPILDPELDREVEVMGRYLARAPQPAPLVSLTGPDPDLLLAVASHLMATAELSLLQLDGAALASHASPEEIVARLLRELQLRDAALVVRSVDQLIKEGRPTPALRRLISAPWQRPCVLLAPEPWNGAEIAASVAWLRLHLPVPSVAVRQQLWAAALSGQAPKVDLTELADRFRLTGRQIAAAARQAEIHASTVEPPRALTRADLFTSCRAQASTELTGLAQHIESIYEWEDLVLPRAIKAQLQSLEHWVRYRPVVYNRWGFAERIMLGLGLGVLFSGPSGTGKTMAAGILARKLELDLYRIDLSSVVSKYIGETEKNLNRIFDAAEAANAILFFDEADALFGKRSEVKDAHDRYANIEVDYLLQRMEAYDGVAILATNFRQNLDQAFARRLQVTVEFPLPQAADRERIWRQLLTSDVPQASDLDLGFLAHQFSFSGGNIRNCVLTAAFAAAADKGGIAMVHLIQAVVRELEKLERPIVSSNFGPYCDLIRTDSAVARSA